MTSPPAKRRGRGRPPGTIWDKLDPNDVHRWLWGLADERQRVTAVSRHVFKHYGQHRNGPALLVRKLEAEGRIRVVKIGGRRERTYEIVDPDLYDPADHSTHIRRRSAPAWG